MRHQQRAQGIGYRFFDFTLTQDNQLMRKSTFIRTGAKELAVLRVLIESAGQLVEKNDLLDKVWGSAIVSEESLARCIYVLRKIFRQDKEKVYIQTIYSKGYVFVAEVCEFIPVPYEISPDPVSVPTPIPAPEAVDYEEILQKIFGMDITYIEISGKKHMAIGVKILLPTNELTDKKRKC
jgi:DNA-binding winged helix-turn-helix (wHTH) protein